MGITIVQKSDLSRPKPNAKTALVLAGGAITGGTFKVGGIKAFNDFLVTKKITDFDIYVGLSAGGFLAAPLAGGISPEEILKSLDGSSPFFSQLSPLHLFWPNWREFIERPLRLLYRRSTYFPGILYDILCAIPGLRNTVKTGFLDLIHNPSYSTFEALLKPMARVIYSSRTLPTLSEALPSGFFDNSNLERYLRQNMERNHLTNNFKVLKRVRNKSLYIAATNIDTSERVVFGPDEKNDVTISEAVQASTALPGFFKPARIQGVDYVDGAVRRTANIDIARDKGADLIICYNPFRPIHNKIFLEYIREEKKYVTRNRRISDSGLVMIFNQVFRTLFHSRLHYGIELLQQNRQFKGDVILIEPKEDDSVFFEISPFAFWNRAKAARHGFESVRKSIIARFDEISAVMASYGIEMSRELVDKDYQKLTKPAADDATIMKVLEKLPIAREVIRKRAPKKKSLRLVSG